MIKFKPTDRTVRQTVCDFEYNEGGELKTAEMRVFYYSPTIAESQAELERMEVRAKKKEIYWDSESLAERLHSLPDIVDPDTEKPHEITVELLKSFDIKNLNRISEAIKKDLQGKSEGSK